MGRKWGIFINKHTIQISPQRSQRRKNVPFSDNKFIIYNTVKSWLWILKVICISLVYWKLLLFFPVMSESYIPVAYLLGSRREVYKWWSMGQSSPPPVSVNTVLLIHSHRHSVMYYLWTRDHASVGSLGVACGIRPKPALWHPLRCTRLQEGYQIAGQAEEPTGAQSKPGRDTGG